MPLVAAAAAEHESHRTARIAAGRFRKIERERRIAIGFLLDVFVDRRLALAVAGPAAVGRIAHRLRFRVVVGAEPIVAVAARIGIDPELVLREIRVEIPVSVGREVAGQSEITIRIAIRPAPPAKVSRRLPANTTFVEK